MGFIDYIQTAGEQEIDSLGRNLRMKQPVVNILLGEFSEKERRALEYYPGRYVNTRENIFWLCTKGQRKEDFVLTLPEHCGKYGLNIRAKVKEYAQSSETLKKELQSYAGTIFNCSASTHTGFQNPGCLQMNFLVKPDEAAAGLLEPLVSLAEDAFAVYYDGQRKKEAYLFIDQRAGAEQADERRASNYLSLCETDRMLQGTDGKRKFRMAYFLSNFDSRGVLRQDYEKERCAAFGMLFLMKNAVPDGRNGNIYRDEDFGQAIDGKASLHNQEPGMFCSLGYMSLESREILARLAVYRTVFEELMSVRSGLSLETYSKELNLTEADWKETVSKHGCGIPYTEMDWRSIVRKPVMESELIGKTNGNCIERLYGKHLDLYLELNCRNQEQTLQTADKWIGELTKNLQITGRREYLSLFEQTMILGWIEEELLRQEENCVQADRGCQDKLEEWERIRCSNLSRKKLAVTKESESLFLQSREYITRKQRVMEAQARKNTFSCMRGNLKSLSERFAGYQKLIKDAYEDLERKIREIGRMTPAEKELQTVNSDAYYSEAARRILKKSAGYGDLCEKICGMAFSGEKAEVSAEYIYRQVCDFCEREVMDRIGFHKEFMEEIFHRLRGYKTQSGKELRDPDDIADYMLQMIDQCKFYMFKSIFGLNRIHEEMCFLLDSGSKFAQADGNGALAVKLIRDNRLKLFREDGCERLDVLFLAGNICKEELYQFESYKKSYLDMTQGG